MPIVDAKQSRLDALAAFATLKGLANGEIALVMGDQLSENLPHQDAVIGEDIIVMGELSAEATSVRHHKQKIADFLAMRHFAKACEADGHTVYYHQYDHDNGAKDLLNCSPMQ